MMVLAFFLFLLGIISHAAALFFAFGCGVEGERNHNGGKENPLLGFYVFLVIFFAGTGLVLIMGSAKVVV